MTAHTCENCRRDTSYDTIPAQQIGNHPIPAYTVCGFCGWAVPIEETA
ncbi:hypothetical protein [Mycolicibacterium fortuitum]|uniref:Uncharacterized protein n=1 Tax=Mycolicibacterium fortuitum TaxID=1766 RepID=A0AAE4V5T8_MYCFO|nr:hypothetical protein [Mycolicibacterium fortuitum]MDV7194630.1 hypothetical protein [Mycolicibacterium fortuitum]MDV7208630.1 hypothetical protein [Mycolicibacterium fortuitum]MDV7230527.1 hypothetical protein [Mycolicibacterium fortuitum]MDV7261866.1 hypothetical protein [Mycolicibacterium fortuitum]MDV7287024.1 hypothetical protein [Mycolicibacterium fortuitum]